MASVITITDEKLSHGIRSAQRKVVFVAPGVGTATAEALIDGMTRDGVLMTIIIDANEDAYRVGYGDPSALKRLHEAAAENFFPLRCQPGLRIGLVITDDDLVIWSPTPSAVESERSEGEPNAILMSGAPAGQVAASVGAEDSGVLPSDAEIGQEPLTPAVLEETVQRLTENPPAPFDLARKARVFSTRFQFVEFELRGAEWTQRKIKLSSLLLNADLPDELQDILETQVRPYQATADEQFEVPVIINGVAAYDREGNRLVTKATQADVSKQWFAIRDKYLKQIKGFGWLISKDQLTAFQAEVSEYEEVLRTWVTAFRQHAAQQEDKLIATIVSSIQERLSRAAKKENHSKDDLQGMVKDGLERMRITEPKVRLVLKNVAWESTRDEEFTAALQQAFNKEELAGWFSEFTAAVQKPPGPQQASLYP